VLENSTEKVACIVNDVASINIDAKLVRNDRNKARGEGVNTTSDLADTIELANGCACGWLACCCRPASRWPSAGPLPASQAAELPRDAPRCVPGMHPGPPAAPGAPHCLTWRPAGCNLQDELFASFEKILALSDQRGEPYTRIILENSGVAEPKNIRDKFAEAAAEGHPLMDRVQLDTLVTVVDSGTFIKDYSSRAPLAARPDLGDGGNLRPVVDLLVEQIETADFVVLNKTDLLDGDKLEQLEAIVASLNPLAQVSAGTLLGLLGCAQLGRLLLAAGAAVPCRCSGCAASGGTAELGLD
jgi:G3E family GTPase